ncbi:hypothetical protein O0L34_g7356 [Tuta absoluta]|nr:hypothetical protein O0L34_g7356 [Tuta absoluta]
MKIIIQLFPVIILAGYSTCQEALKTYRKGYVLHNNGNIYYKYHERKVSWDNANRTCEDEGATLFYPENVAEKYALRDFLEPKLSSKGQHLHIGVYVAKGTGFVTTVDNEPFTQLIDYSNAKEGARICMSFYYDVNMRIIGNGCDLVASNSQLLAGFVCKIAQKSIRLNNECNLYSSVKHTNDYEYSSKLDKCYKLHKEPRTWMEAYYTCDDEHSSLAELNSWEEAEHLKKIVSAVPEEQSGVVCLGFKLEKDGWKTLSGLYLQDSGYPMWAHTQPDGGWQEGYGAMAYNGRLHDINSESLCIFVCEHKVERTSV